MIFQCEAGKVLITKLAKLLAEVRGLEFAPIKFEVAIGNTVNQVFELERTVKELQKHFQS